MGPLDPQQLLSALSPLLTRTGGIKGPDEAARISGLMKDAVKKVGKCIYINILKATQSEDALAKLLESDGWTTLNSWLQECKDEDNKPLLIEMLKLYQNLPVTIQILKQNNAAKLIKQLSKSEDEKIKILSTNIVESWMKKIRGRNSNAENENDKNKKKKKDKHKETKDGKDSKERREKSHHHSDKEGDKDGSNHSSDHSDRLGQKPDSKSDKDSSKEDAKKRPKTVKTFAAKFRSTGIGEDKAVAPVKKKSQDTNKLPLLKRSVQDAKPDEIPEKKPRLTLSMPPLSTASALNSSRAAVSPTEIHGRIKVIPPKKPPEFHESSGFMDSLITKPTSYAVKRRKKISPGKPTTTPTSPTSPTMSNTSPTSQVPPSPTTALAQKLPSVPSFYKDTLETAEETSKDDRRSPSPEEKMDTEDADMKSVVDKLEGEMANHDLHLNEDPDQLTESNAEPMIDDLPEYSTQEPKSLLTTGSTKRRKPKKNVSWADESRIREFFYFDLDETERVNVNRPKDSFNMLKKQEMMMDRKAMESAKRLINDNMVEALPWRTPPFFDDSSVFDYGANSTEKDIQKAREQKVLQAIFFSKTMVPDTPSEPELESIEPSQPRIIPLEDENAGEELSYTYENLYPQTTVQQLPPPPTVDPYSLPPELANVLASIQQQQHDPSAQQATNTALANIQNVIASYLAGSEGKTGELSENLRHALEPFKQQLPDFMQGFGPENGPPGPHGPMIPGARPGLLGTAPPGFPPMGGPMPPRFPGPGPGPGPGMGGPGGPGMGGLGPGMGGPGGPGIGGPGGPGGPGDSDDWGENMMGGPPHGPPMRGRGGMPYMRGGPPRGLPPRMMRGRGGRGGPRTRPVCRHFVQPGGCRFGNSCNFLHPGVNGPPNP
ncbi:serine/threonine-protein phosphatase 1 regulatory subunit 10-like isoform X2 [Haliotis cracherodii]|uniref:serine/threonine-protein phosphatase 1 regulatory subunit 10-like isoform X2 n=1 Tax=Haliotis cracherodii TaxID=6455 RepID=UPI0039E8DC93